MARTEKEYQKLGGKGRPPFPASLAGGASQLYLGKDHLLKIESSYWSERYRRYYFKDIRLLQATETRSALVGMILLWLLTLFFGMVAWFTADEARLIFIITALVFGTIAIWKTALGASCKVQITTPLGADTLFSLSRLRVARKVLARIVPLIREAQETIEPATLASRVARETPGPLAARTIPHLAPSTIAAQSGNTENRPGKKWLAYLFAASLLIHAGLLLTQAMRPTTGVFAIGLGVLGVAFLLSVFLMIRPAPGAPRKVVLSFFIYIGAYIVFFYIIMFQLVVADPVKMSRQNAVYPAIHEKAAQATRFNFYFNLFAAATSGVIGLLVAIQVGSHKLETGGKINLPPAE